jgi:PIN domain nuclease of toxin-antitoxin system
MISLWEVALLAERGRLRFSLSPRIWLESAAEASDTSIVALTVSIVSTAVGLRGLRDPADQLIVATAMEAGSRLVTSDTAISSSGIINAIA